MPGMCETGTGGREGSCLPVRAAFAEQQFGLLQGQRFAEEVMPLTRA